MNDHPEFSDPHIWPEIVNIFLHQIFIDPCQTIDKLVNIFQQNLTCVIGTRVLECVHNCLSCDDLDLIYGKVT